MKKEVLYIWISLIIFGLIFWVLSIKTQEKIQKVDAVQEGEISKYRNCDIDFDYKNYREEINKYEIGCTVKNGESFVLYDSTEGNNERCPGKTIKASVFGGCYRSYLLYEEINLLEQELVEETGCTDKIYSLFTPQSLGNYHIDSKGSCDYNVDYHIVVVE